MKCNHRWVVALAAIGLTIAASNATAQEYPSKTVTFIVSFSAGGNNDLRARLLANKLTTILGKPIVVDNRPGAAGNIGHAQVANASPDGHTVAIAAMGPMSVNPYIYPNIGFDPGKDLLPVVLIERAPLVLVTRVDKPYKTLADLVDAAKAKPGMINIANAGTGGAHHLAAVSLEKAAGIQMLSVPYKGGGPASMALLSGEVDCMFEQTYAALPSIQGGKTRPLAVTSAKRLPSLPDVPTMAELGYPQLTISNWLGVAVPKGTPRAVISKLNEAFNKALAMPDVREQIEGPGNEIGGGTPEDFGALIASENKRWSALVKSVGIKLE